MHSVIGPLHGLIPVSEQGAGMGGDGHSKVNSNRAKEGQKPNWVCEAMELGVDAP